VSGPAFIVHSLDHARAALAAAAEAGAAVVLVSPPGAAAFMGAEYFRAMVARARAEHPAAEAEAVLDCADKAGHALGAIRNGAEAVRFTGPKATREKLAAIAHAAGARLHSGRVRALDLASVPDPWRAARAHLAAKARRP